MKLGYHYMICMLFGLHVGMTYATTTDSVDTTGLPDPEVTDNTSAATSTDSVYTATTVTPVFLNVTVSSPTIVLKDDSEKSIVTCTATVSPWSAVSWNFRAPPSTINAPIADGNTIQFNFTDAAYSAVGDYSCTATIQNSSSPLMKTAKFVVEATLNVTVSNLSITVEDNDEERVVTCTASEIPKSWFNDIEWTASGPSDSIIGARRPNGSTVQFNFTKAAYSAAGSYSCNASINGNAESALTETATFMVEATPKLLRSSTDETILSYTRSFTCNFDGDAAVAVQWTVNNQHRESKTIRLESSISSTLSVVNGIILGPNASIECWAKNSLGPSKTGKFNINNGSNWKTFKGDIFVFSPFQSKYNYHKASSTCAELGGDLSDALDQETNAFLSMAAENDWNDSESSTGSGGSNTGESFFLGGRRNGSAWYWPNGEKFYDKTASGNNGFTNWADGYPKDEGDCMVMKQPDDGIGKWKWMNLDCDLTEAFVCQIKVVQINSIEEDCGNYTVEWSYWERLKEQFSYTILKNGTMMPSVNKMPSSPYNDRKTFMDFRESSSYNIRLKLDIWTGKDVNDSYEVEEITQTKTSQIRLDMIDTYCNISVDVFNCKNQTQFEITIEQNKDSTFRSQVMSQSISTPPKSIHQVPMDPNRQIVIRLPYSSPNTTGKCVTDVAVPNVTIGPEIEQESENVTISPSNETYGYIKCYFLLAIQTSGEVSDLTVTDQLINDAINGGSQGSFCLSTFTRFVEKQYVTMGDKNTTTCVLTSKQYRCDNIVLAPATKYGFFVVTSLESNSNKALFGSSEGVEFVTKESPSTSSIAVALGTIGGILILIILVLIVYKARRKTNLSKILSISYSTKKSSQPVEEKDAYYNSPQFLKSFLMTRDTLVKKYVDNAGKTENNELHAEMNKIKEISSQLGFSQFLATSRENVQKNRYTNILPYDKTCVKLTPSNENSKNTYINASIVEGYYHRNKFIASQGPLPHTVDDFWTMIWQKDCRIIVMLANVEEGGNQKCAKYWPDEGETKEARNLRISFKEEENYGSFVVRKFCIEEYQNEVSLGAKEIIQFHYVIWPDHGTPATTSGLIRFRKAVTECEAEMRPIVVHCSAGVGRTGTFIGLDCLIDQISKEQKINVFAVILNMRKQRVEMVQNQDQYVFLYKIFAEIFVFGYTEVSPRQLLGRTAAIDQTTGQLQNEKVLREFKNLTVLPLVHEETYPLDDQNATLFMHSCVETKTGDDDEQEYIDASFVEVYKSQDKWIAAKQPHHDEIKWFWRAVLDNDVSHVIDLDQSNDKEGDDDKKLKFIPEEIDQVLHNDDVTLTLQAIEEKSSHVERKVMVERHTLKLKSVVTIISYDIEESGSPSMEKYLQLITLMQRIRENEKKPTTLLVQCSDGASKCGVFFAVFNLVERFRTVQKLDIFRTVKDLRDLRPMMVKTYEQYCQCYLAVKTYLMSSEVYQNLVGDDDDDDEDADYDDDDEDDDEEDDDEEDDNEFEEDCSSDGNLESHSTSPKNTVTNRVQSEEELEEVVIGSDAERSVEDEGTEDSSTEEGNMSYTEEDNDEVPDVVVLDRHDENGSNSSHKLTGHATHKTTNF